MLMVLQLICIRVKAPSQAFQISRSERLAGSGPILWRKWCWDNVDLDLDPQLLGCATFANFARRYQGRQRWQRSLDRGQKFFVVAQKYDGEWPQIPSLGRAEGRNAAETVYLSDFADTRVQVANTCKNIWRENFIALGAHSERCANRHRRAPYRPGEARGRAAKEVVEQEQS